MSKAQIVYSEVKFTLQEAVKAQMVGNYSFFNLGAISVMSGHRYAPAALSPVKRPDTDCTGGWVGPRAGLDGCRKSRLQRDSIPGPTSP
jgi:hypothetical protein